ncbi:MAG: hypothetical protein ACLQDY_27195 [Streptosporangiaceae bacterium]
MDRNFTEASGQHRAAVRAIARVLHEDEAHRQADLHEVAEEAEEEAEAVPDWPPGP